ncbi:hypothetical protein K9M41_03820 [Candidatus Gracilibacteria bacterium]|nr:hypothetical protein [Candidatus Gracilibacteria bacterium]
MKKVISYPFSLIPGLILVIILISTSSFALDVDPDQGIEDMDNPVVLAWPTGLDNPSCVDNYEDWPNSNEFNPNNDWSLSNFPAGETVPDRTFKQLADVNGDGLLDLLYYYKYVNGQFHYNQTFECLMLNNGHGWDIVYRCATGRNDMGNAYYGDCALIEE